MKNRKNKKGFTLIELAIVLVIIGLLIAAILKGEALINNAKQQRLYKMKQEIEAAMLTYYDKYNAYPGDDPQAQSHLNDPNTKNGNGNGRIEGGWIWDCTSDDTEVCAFWEHLRLAGILSGSGVTNPTTPYGGKAAVDFAAVQGKYANWLAFENVPSQVAKVIDEKYDDGNYQTGTIRANADYDSRDEVTLYFELQ